MTEFPSDTDDEDLGPRRGMLVETFRRNAHLLAKLTLMEATLEDSFLKILRELHLLQSRRKERPRG